MNKRLALCTLATGFVMSTSWAQTSAPPKIVEERRGNITDIHVEGQLAPTRAIDCIEIEQVDRHYTPPDLYTGVLKCVRRNDFEAAARLEIVGLAFARFDAERVADPTARDAGQVLTYQLAGLLRPEERTSLGASFTRLVQDAGAHHAFCDRMTKVGSPDYQPTYMILHGMNAITKPGSTDDPLVAGFDPVATWARVERDYLHCIE